MEKKTTKSKKATIEIVQCNKVGVGMFYITLKIKQLYTMIVSRDIEGFNFYYLDGKTPSNKEEVEQHISMDLMYNY